MKNRNRSRINKILLFLGAVVICFVTVFVLVQGREENKGYRTVSVIEVSGRVGVVKDGVEYSAYPGMKLQEGYEIVTGGESYARLALDDDKYVKLESGSRLIFETLGLLGSGKTRLCLERGALTTELVSPLEKDEEYVVNTPNAILAVRGTYFRIELEMLENGEVDANVLTYGGQVVSRRIMPDGEIIDEEVFVNAGYKTRINKNSKETVYVIEGQTVEETTVATTEKTEPIEKEDISDDDLIDIYFSAQNGHSLFVTEQEAEADIQNRGIVLEEHISVYEKTQQIRQYEKEDRADEGEVPADRTVADDKQPLVYAEEEKDDNETASSEEDWVMVMGPVTDGVGNNTDNSDKDSDSVDTDDANTDNSNGNESNGEENVNAGDSEINDLPVHQHTVGFVGEEKVHSKCTECGEILEENHSFTLDGTVEATCTEKGAEKYVCECGYSYVVELAAYGHDYTETVTKQATCMEEGIIVCLCDCGDSYEKAIDILPHIEVSGGVEGCHSKCNLCGQTISTQHSFVEASTTATCTTPGQATYTCVCGYSYKKETPAAGHREVPAGEENIHSKCGACGIVLADGSSHSYTDVTTPADCETAGKTVYTCDCGHSYEEEIPATGHSAEAGGTETVHSKCSVCGNVLADGSGHDYTDVTTPATCERAGKTVYTCGCGYSYEEVIPATGHSAEAGGTETVHSKCSVCGNVLADGSGHDYIDETTPATCEIAGKTVYTCECGYSYEKEIPATGHSAEAGGTETVHSKCSVCGNVLADGSSHSYTDVTTPADCETAGKTVYTCDCGYSYEEEIPATGHSAEAGGTETVHSKCSVCGNVLADGDGHAYTEATTPAECETAGKTVYTCECGYSYEEEIPATGHSTEAGGTETVHSKCSVCGNVLADGSSHNYTEATTPADCETAGKTVYTCDCGYSYEEEIPATGHDYTITTLPASCTEDGLATYECECGAGYEEVLPATGHTKADAMASKTTCSGCGEEWIDIDAVNFPDEKFRMYVERFDTDYSGYLLSSEIGAVTAIDISGNSSEDGGYTDLTGIEYFTEITSFACSYNSGLTELDLSQNTKVTQMNLSHCGITSASDIAMSQTASITDLDISYNNIEFMAGEDFGWLEAVTSFSANYATISDDDWTAISVVLPSTLQNLQLSGNELTTFNLAGHTGLTNINLSYNTSLTSVNLSGCTALTSLDITDCTSLDSLDVSGCTLLEDIDDAVNSCQLLSTLNASNSGLIALSVSNGSSLQNLDISNTPMRALYVEGSYLNSLTLENLAYLEEVSLNNTPMQTLTITNCNISRLLSVTYCDSLTDVTTTTTPIAAVLFTGCTGLKVIDMAGTGMKDFEFDSCSYLRELTLDGSKITTFVLNGSFYSAVSSLSLADCTELATLTLNSCAAMTDLNISGCTSLASVDLSSCTSLTSVSTGGRFAEGTLSITGLADESIISD